MRVGMRGLMVGLVLAGAGGAELAAQEGRSEWVARAEALVRDLEAGRFGEAESRFAPEVRTQLDSARLAGVWTQITMVAGALGELTPRTDTVEAGNHLVELDAAFERQSLLVRVVMAADGQVIGYLALFDETLVEAAHTVECLVRQPESLANLLEAAGGLALERSGAILDVRVAGGGGDLPPAGEAPA